MYNKALVSTKRLWFLAWKATKSLKRIRRVHKQIFLHTIYNYNIYYTRIRKLLSDTDSRPCDIWKVMVVRDVYHATHLGIVSTTYIHGNTFQTFQIV